MAVEPIPGLVVDTKVCLRCRESKLPAEFHRSKSAHDGRQNWCKQCTLAYRKEWRARNVLKIRQEVYEANLRRKYGLTLADYQALFERQGGLCAICREPESSLNRDGSRRRLHVDHDHKTGEVRNLLCSRCNSVLGYIESHPDRIDAVRVYLSNWTLRSG